MADGILDAAAPRQRRLRWPRWVLSLLLSGGAYLAAEYAVEQASFTHAGALERAIGQMIDTCRSECLARGVRLEDLDGPYEAPVNAQPGTRHFQFLWKTGAAEDLVVVVYNNRLFVDAESWWERQDWWYKPGQAPGHAASR